PTSEPSPLSLHDALPILSAVGEAAWFGLPELHAPQFQLSAVLVALPAVIALIAENAGHVKAVQEMTGDDLDPYMGRAIAADGIRSEEHTSELQSRENLVC